MYYKVNAAGFQPSYYREYSAAYILYQTLAKMVDNGKLEGASIQKINRNRLQKEIFRFPGWRVH